MELFEELKWRGLVDNVTSEEVEDVINNGEVTFYIGTDPTADSLHIGHYSSLLMAKRLEKHGHHPIMLVGGATGFIGDPKATGERSMLTPEVLKSNYDALHAQISKLWGFDMVNNLDWTKDITIIDFLRDYGKLFNVNYMLNKETVKETFRFRNQLYRIFLYDPSIFGFLKSIPDKRLYNADWWTGPMGKYYFRFGIDS